MLPPRIAHYPVVRELGMGGMGVVYEVKDPTLPRSLALKTVIAGKASASAVTRFLREAEALAKVTHRHVIKVHEIGQWQEGHYLTLDLIEGKTLQASVVDGGSWDAPRVARLGRELADALAAVHAAGVLHRDLKPQNVMLREDGSPVLLDFGLVRDVTAETLTRTGEVMGTPEYMCPEQANGTPPKELTAGVDVHGLGCVLYYLLSGRSPFLGATAYQVLTAVMLKPVTPLRSLNPKVPRALEAVIAKSMEKDPAHRYGDMRAFQADLDRVLAGEAPHARGRGRRKALFAAVAGAVVLLALIGGLLASGSGETGEGRGSIAAQGSQGGAATDVEASLAKAPVWYRAQRDTERPPLPLPSGLTFGKTRGEYEWGRDGSVLVWVPAASFTLGRPATMVSVGDLSNKALKDMGHQLNAVREATLTRGYFIGKYELTVGQYSAFTRAKGMKPPKTKYQMRVEPNLDKGLGSTWHHGEGLKVVVGDAYPVTRMLWREAAGYCEWVGLRLPTELEWEYAARGPKGNRFPWGDEPPAPGRISKNGPDDGYPYVAPVGSFELDRSPFGCFDMGGNTSEWVADCLAPFPEGPLVDYMRRNTKVRYHVVRGGCWTYASEGGFETTRRGGYWREKDRSNIGFRVALSHSPPSEGPQEEPHALWNPEVGTQYDLALHCQEGNDTTLASIELWLRATAESLDGPRATLRFTLNRIRRSYGPRLGGSRVFDSEVADSEPELQHLVGKTFTGSLNMDTGRLRDLDGLGPIRDAYVAGRDAPSDTRKTPFGKWTPLNHMKAFLGDGFLESALARLLWQGEATPLPWQRTSSEGEAPQTIRLRSGSRDALFSYMLLKGVKPTDQVAWEGQAEFEPGRFEGSTSRGDLVSGERHSGWSKTKLTMVRVGD